MKKTTESKKTPVTYDGENIEKFAAAAKRVKNGKYANASLFEALKKATDSERERKKFLKEFTEDEQELIGRQELLDSFARSLHKIEEAAKILVGDKLNGQFFALQLHSKDFTKISDLYNRIEKCITAESLIFAERKWLAALRAEKVKIDWQLVDAVFGEKWKRLRALERGCKGACLRFSFSDVLRLAQLIKRAEQNAKELGEIIADEKVKGRASFCDEFARIWQSEKDIVKRDYFFTKAMWTLFVNDRRETVSGEEFLTSEDLLWIFLPQTLHTVSPPKELPIANDGIKKPKRKHTVSLPQELATIRKASGLCFYKPQRGGQSVGFTKNDVVRLAKKFAKREGCSLETETFALTKTWKRLGLEWLPSKAAGRPQGIREKQFRASKRITA